MKKRRTVVVAFLLIAVIAIGVGYAAVSDTLDITGTADVSITAAEEAFNQDIYWSAASNGEGYTANINTNNTDKAQYTVTGLKGKDDTVSITFTMINNGDLDATVAIKGTASNTNTEYFEVEYSDTTFDLTANGGTKDVTVTVTLLKTPTEAQSGTFIIELVATSDATTVTD